MKWSEKHTLKQPINIKTAPITNKTIPKASKTYFTTVSIVIGAVTLEWKSSAFFLSISACWNSHQNIFYDPTITHFIKPQ